MMNDRESMPGGGTDGPTKKADGVMFVEGLLSSGEPGQVQEGWTWPARFLEVKMQTG